MYLSARKPTTYASVFRSLLNLLFNQLFNQTKTFSGFFLSLLLNIQFHQGSETAHGGRLSGSAREGAPGRFRYTGPNGRGRTR